MSEKANRLLKIYSRLRKGPLTIQNLKDWTLNNNIPISERTLYRDLEELQKSILLEGEQIVEFIGEKNKKTWKLIYSSSTNEINEYDINSFKLFKNFAPLAILQSREKSIEKFEEKFYSAYSKSKFELNGTITDSQVLTSNFYEFPYSDQYHKILDDSIWAVQNHRIIEIMEIEFDHTSIASSVSFPQSFLPLKILYHRGCIHIAGVLTKHNKVIILAIEQFKKYQLTNIAFNPAKKIKLLEKEMSKRFGITENSDDKLYKIELEFSELTGSFINHHFWHSSQKMKQLKNGNYILQLHCGINRELVGWIFQWMNNCKVINPKALKELVEIKINEMQDLYSSDKKMQSNNSFRKT